MQKLIRKLIIIIIPMSPAKAYLSCGTFNVFLTCFPAYIFNTTMPLWWRHQMETFSALLALCAGNSPVTGEFSAQWPVTRSFNVFFDLRLNKRLSKQSWGWWSGTPSRSLWRHFNVSPWSLAWRTCCWLSEQVCGLVNIYFSRGHVATKPITLTLPLSKIKQKYVLLSQKSYDMIAKLITLAHDSRRSCENFNDDIASNGVKAKIAFE